MEPRAQSLNLNDEPKTENKGLKRVGRIIFLCHHDTHGNCLKGKVKVYISSFKITSSNVDMGKICTHCGPSHTEKAISQQLKHFHDYSSSLPEDQVKIVETISEICKRNDLEYEIIDIANLNILGKMKLFFKGIRAPAMTFEGKKIEGMPTKEDLKVLTD